MTTDYAGELLGAKPAAATKDYASELLSPKAAEPSRFEGQSFKTLPIVNRESNDGTADFRTLAKAAMVDDPQTKLRIFANDLFPGDKSAPSRFGIIGGEVVYVGKDDKLYRATPGGVAGGAKEFAANMAGNALPIAGAIAGGLSPVIGGAFIGGAGGKAAQTIIANTVLDEPQTPLRNVAGISQEGLFSQAGQIMGNGLSSWLTRNAVKDVSKLNPAEVATLDKKAADIGVNSMNLGQRTNLRSLRGQAEMLARNPGTQDAMEASLKQTNDEAAAAANKYVEGFSPFKSIRDTGEAGRAGAVGILDKLAEWRSVAAKPWYEKALSAPVDTKNPALSELAGTDAFKRGYERALKIAANDGIDITKESNAMKMLHYVKLGIDDLLDKSTAVKEGVGSTERASIVNVKNRLVGFLDSQSPDYARARSIFGHYMPTIKASREGILGQLADLPDDQLMRAGKIVFSPSNSPQDIAALRSMFYRYDQPERWKGLLKGYLQDTLEASGKEFKSGNQTGQATTWRYALLGDPKQAANLRAAMTDEQFTAFKNMMDVFEAVGRVKGSGNSITAEMQAQKEALQDGSKSKIASLMKPRQSIIDWLEEAKLGKHADRMVEIMNSKDGIAQIAELRKLSPNEDRFYKGMGRLLGISLSPETNKDTPPGK